MALPTEEPFFEAVPFQLNPCGGHTKKRVCRELGKDVEWSRTRH